MQMFQKGDYTQVIDTCETSRNAIVLGSYRDYYGRGSVLDYYMHDVQTGEKFWAHESSMVLLDTCRMDLVKAPNYHVVKGLTAYRRMQYGYSNLGCAQP